MTKIKKFKQEFLNASGESDLIKRYSLPDYCAYTNGGSLLRSDASLGREFKFCRFSKSFNPDEKVSKCWDLSESDRLMLNAEHAEMTFPVKGEEGYKGAGGTVYFIKFYGRGTSRQQPSISSDIKKEIHSRPCACCGTTTNIECDHKNDLILDQNDERVLNITTQTINDFQALCRHCNDTKRAVKKRTLKQKKRQPAPGFKVQFTQGDDTFNVDDKFWYIGTYWGDVLAFKGKLGLI